jgi:glucan phosphoethanolaminetransferase (alkaline phosphatase superfamily)
MKNFSQKVVLHFSIFIFIFIAFLFLSNHFKIELGKLTIVLELLTIPVLIMQFVLLIITIKRLIKNQANKYYIFSLILLTSTCIFTLVSFLI